MPFYSIIIASLNDERNLRNLSTSLNSQSFLDYEVLISDGGSTDGSVDYISQGGFQNMTWYKSSKDNGIYDALNIALEHVSGKWVLVLGADDKLANAGALLRAYQALTILPDEVAMAYADLLILRNSKITLKKYPEFDKFRDMFGGGAFIHHQSAFVKRQYLLKYGKFSEKYKIHSDYDLMTKVSLNALTIKIDGAFVVFNSAGFSSKLSNILRSLTEVYLIRRSHGITPMPLRLLLVYCSAVLSSFRYIFQSNWR